VKVEGVFSQVWNL